MQGTSIIGDSVTFSNSDLVSITH